MTSKYKTYTKKTGMRLPRVAAVLGVGTLVAGAHLPAQAFVTCQANTDTFAVQQDTTLNHFNVRANDTLAAGNCLTSVLSSPAHGVLTLNGPGVFTYVPNNGFVGTDQFVYQELFWHTDKSNAIVTINVTSPTAVSVPQDPIAPLPSLPPVGGIGSQPVVLDLQNGQGPDMIACLLATVRSLLGADAQYLGQVSTGVASFSVGGGRLLAFYPVQASTFAGQTNDIHLTSSNVLNVGTSCGNFNVIPALFNVKEFGSLLNGMGLKAEINAQGVTLLTIGSTVYTFRPDYFVTTGRPAAPSLVQGADGLYRWTDSAGNVQILRPAFLDTDGLLSQVQYALGAGGSIAIQTDGTALFTAFNGTQHVLTPDLTLTQASAANADKFVWQDGPNHYLYRSSLLLLAQGFTVQRR